MNIRFPVEPFAFESELEPGVFASQTAPEMPPINRADPAFVRWVQAALNQLMGAGLAEDGILGPLTRAAVRAFQEAQGLVVDGIVGPQTAGRLQILLGEQPGPNPGDEPGGDAPLAWGARVSPGFRERVRALAASLGCDPSHLMAVMAFETGETFSPSIRNRLSGATGLIQFMPATARGLGTTTQALAEMTAEEQLDYVARYFAPFRGRLRSLEDVYMAVLWPRAVGAANDTALFAQPSRAYDQNKGLDLNRDGVVTKAEAAALVRQKLARGLQPGNVA